MIVVVMVRAIVANGGARRSFQELAPSFRCWRVGLLVGFGYFGSESTGLFNMQFLANPSPSLVDLETLESPVLFAYRGTLWKFIL